MTTYLPIPQRASLAPCRIGHFCVLFFPMSFIAMSFIGQLRTVLTLGKGVISGLSEDAAGRDPIALFSRWFEDAKRSGILLPETMALATCDKDGHPAARMVLLKGFDERGFVFYTNYVSRKSEELEETQTPPYSYTGPFSSDRFGSRAPRSGSRPKSLPPISAHAPGGANSVLGHQGRARRWGTRKNSKTGSASTRTSTAAARCRGHSSGEATGSRPE